MRLISFSLTTAAFLDGSKTVTRRTGWKHLTPGTRLMGVEKAMGLRAGEKVKHLGVLEVVSVRREPLSAIRDEGARGAELEGFPNLSADEFVAHFCAAMRVKEDVEVARIEFRRVADGAAS